MVFGIFFCSEKLLLFIYFALNLDSYALISTWRTNPVHLLPAVREGKTPKKDCLTFSCKEIMTLLDSQHVDKKSEKQVNSGYLKRRCIRGTKSGVQTRMESPAKTFSDSHSTLQTTEANKNTVIVEFVYKEENVSLDKPGSSTELGFIRKMVDKHVREESQRRCSGESTGKQGWGGKSYRQVRTDEVVGLLVHKQLNITLLLKNLLININTIKNLKDTDGGINIGTSLSFSIWIISCQLRIQNFSQFLSWVF